jgi:hypothetical protein
MKGMIIKHKTDKEAVNLTALQCFHKYLAVDISVTGLLLQTKAR